ncbi:MAG: iron export ABC transporter permease subunit FetB [Limnochordaceae bacterium]|nr:iron export ABC transporter permease subunit FetB [Limnochordaceae bacterium]
MNTGVIPISDAQLALSVVLVLLAGGVSAALQLGLLRPLLVGTLRTFVQLMLIGYVLAFIFESNRPWLVFLVAVAMTAVATQAATARTRDVTRYPRELAFAALFASSVLVGGIVVGLIIRPEPWYSARVAIPIFGMILGNSMNGVALALQRLYGSTRERLAEVEELLAFGATPWEAVRESVKEAVRTGMTPTINSMMVVGLVSLPGMMTGQILGGADPRQAVRYQIVVMLMISAAVALGCLVLVLSAYRRLFTADGALDPELQRSRPDRP